MKISIKRWTKGVGNPNVWTVLVDSSEVGIIWRSGKRWMAQNFKREPVRAFDTPSEAIGFLAVREVAPEDLIGLDLVVT